MKIRQLNKPVFEWSSDHPARRFLEAFIEFRKCIAKLDTLPEVDQEFETQEGATTSFRAFVFNFLSFDIVVDGWLNNASTLTDDERQQLVMLPLMREQLRSCQTAAVRDGNNNVLPLLERAFILLTLWENCVTARIPLYAPGSADPRSAS